MCVCLWFSVLLYVYVVVSVSVPIKRKRLYESPRAVTRLTVYRPRRVEAPLSRTLGSIVSTKRGLLALAMLGARVAQRSTT